MLPTHLVQQVQSSTTNTGSGNQVGSDSSNSTSSGGGGGGDSRMQYPPRAPAVEVASNGSSSGSRKSTSLQSRLCGPRGVTSLTVQTETPHKISSTAEGSSPSSNEAANTIQNKRPGNPSRWNTWEFYIYAIVFFMAVPWMIRTPMNLSLETNPHYWLITDYLRPGWIYGRMRDDSDFQYRSFRDHLPLLTLVMIAYVVISKATERIPARNGYRLVMQPTERYNRKTFLTIFTIAFILTLHGTNSVKLLLACSINYGIVKYVSSTSYAQITPLPVWVWNVGFLFLVHWNEGFSYASINSSLSRLDHYTGLLPRWHINYNITMLRLVSYSMDFFWAKTSQVSETPTEEERACIDADPRKRQGTSLPIQQYSLHNYLLYLLYPPLFIAGPIITFNDFTRQLHHPLSISIKYTIQYTIRLAASVLTMEFLLHYMYVNAIKDARAWRDATPEELSMIGFWSLIFVWLKLLIPWRFFRLWALADGVDVPENMVRCMANNYSTLGFWRSWHRSYNLWNIRYIYIPLGGSANQFLSIPLAFTFVALWHDLSFTLLQWSWLVVIFILPEIAAQFALPKERYGSYIWYRHVCAIGGVINILMMMTANLVGFVVGFDGIKYLWQQILASNAGTHFMMTVCGVLFVGVQVMFEYREEETRRGINRKF